MSISVVICAYTMERWDDLSAAVDSVRRQSTPACEIIVVIDHNPSLLAHAAQQLPDAVVVPNREARGLSGARNSGIAIAQGGIIAFLDDDAVAEPTWLERLSAGYSDSRVLGIGGAIEPMWSSPPPCWFPDEFAWVVGCTYRGMPTRTAVVRNLIGANMSFRRDVFETVGGFRSGIGRIGTRPLGCEETELCIRARQRWPRMVWLYEPEARISHRVPSRRATWAYFRARCYAEGLSKARVARLVGADDGLASERTYTCRTLPLGVLRGLQETMLQRQLAGVARAVAIVAGLVLTMAGYAAGYLAERWPAVLTRWQADESAQHA